MIEHLGKTSGTSDQRVLFVLPRMVAGGVERATLNLIAGLQERGVDCALALGRCHGALLPEARALTHVEEIAGDRKRRWIGGLRRIISGYRPTHIVAAFVDVTLMTHVAARLARSHAVLIIGVHGTLGAHAAVGGWRVRLRFLIQRTLAHPAYRGADAIVAVSQGVADDLRRHYPAVASKVRLIYSPILTRAMQARLQLFNAPVQPAEPRRLVAVGRLAFEKGFDVLLRALPAVIAQLPVHLDVHGEGAEQARLMELAGSLGVQHAVTFNGATCDPLGAMHDANLFVFPSRNEGFGVALVEALACGQQIVASDCAHGPAEILGNGQWGQLVPPENPDALAAAILRSLRGEIRFTPASLRQRAANFSAAPSVADYQTLLSQLAPRSH